MPSSSHLPLLSTDSTIFKLDDEDDDLTPVEQSRPNIILEPSSSSATTGSGFINGRRSPNPPPVKPYRDDGNDDGHGDLESGGAVFAMRGLGLKSNQQSREAEYDLDDDSLSSTGSDATINAALSQPLLIGILPVSRPSGEGARGSLESTGSRLDDLPDWMKKGGGLLAGIANMSNSILGAGIIGLPYAVAEAGFFTGLFLLIALCLVTDWTIRLIVLNAKLSGRNSYIDIMGHCFGEYGRIAVSFFQFAFAFGGMCAFGVIIGDTIPHVIEFIIPPLKNIPVLSLLVNRQCVIALATMCVSYPLSLHRDISKLSKASGVALIGMFIIVCSVLIEGSRVPDEHKGLASARFTFIQPRVFEAIGVIAFAFVCHHNSLLIYGSLNTPTLDRFAYITHVSTALSLVACLAMALTGFLVFTNKTQANILNNFPQSDFLINIARLCFGLNMFTTLPLEAFVCREVIESYFYADQPFNQRRHVIVTTAIVFTTMIVSLLTCDLGIVLELTGGLSATVLAFVFPAACFVKLSDAPNLSWHKTPAWACVAFGLLVMVLNLGLSVGKAISGGGETLKCN